MRKNIVKRHLCTKILFADEAIFSRDDITNTRNTHVWSYDNPHSTKETHFQTRFSVNIWCGIIGNLLIGPVVLEDRLTSQRYLRFLQEELPLMLEDVPLLTRQEMWLQQDGAPPNFGRQVTAFLNQHFPDRWIGRGGPVPWPARSQDLSPLDYFLLGHMKSLVHAVKSNTRAELLNRIMDSGPHIRNDHDSVKRAVTSITRRAQLCIDNHGGHFESRK
jgi:hypothetical protein